MSKSVFAPLDIEAIRRACAAVASRAHRVYIDDERLEQYAESLLPAIAEPTVQHYDRATHYLGDAQATAAFVIVLDTVNFGSGYFPQLQKLPGLSGYFTVAKALKDRFESRGALTASELARLSHEDCAALFNQNQGDPVIQELIELYRQALHDLGDFLLGHFGGSFSAMIEAAEKSARALAGILAHMPFFKDVAAYDDLTVPFYKRAQILPSDLALALPRDDLGQFDDLHELTIYADNLVPHVLRVEEVLKFDDELRHRIDSRMLIASGSAEEVEIRAVALHAVELMVEHLRGTGHDASARAVDLVLWNRGQEPRYKAVPRHRTRTVFY